MKKFLAILLAVVLVFSMTACGGEKADSDVVELEFIQWWSVEAGGEYMHDMVAGFEAENPGIKVTLIEQPFADTQNTAVSTFATGQCADLIGMNPPWTRQFYDNGMLAPLDDLIAADASYSLDNFGGIAEKIDGKQYTVPVTPLAFFLYYNIDMFEEAGIEPPTTLDEFVDASIALTNPEKQQYGFTVALSESSASNGSILSVYPMLYALGGRTIDANGEFTCQSPEMEKVLEALYDMKQAGALTPGAASNSEMMALEEFKGGSAAMMIQSDAHLISLDKAGTVNYGIVTLPTLDGTTTPDLRHHGWDVAICSASEHKEEAWKFVSYMLSKDMQEEMCGSLTKIPAYKGADMTWANDYPNVLKAAQYMEDCKMVEELASMPAAGTCWTELTKAAGAVASGTKTAEEALAECQASWDSILGQ